MIHSNHHSISQRKRRILHLDGMSLTSRYPALRRDGHHGGRSGSLGRKAK